MRTMTYCFGRRRGRDYGGDRGARALRAGDRPCQGAAKDPHRSAGAELHNVHTSRTGIPEPKFAVSALSATPRINYRAGQILWIAFHEKTWASSFATLVGQIVNLLTTRWGKRAELELSRHRAVDKTDAGFRFGSPRLGTRLVDRRRAASRSKNGATGFGYKLASFRVKGRRRALPRPPDLRATNPERIARWRA